MLHHLHIMAQYNAWAHERLMESCSMLSHDEYDRERPAFFKSIHGTLNHILAVDRLWLARLEGREADIHALNQILCDDLEGLWQARRAENHRLLLTVDRLSERDLEHEVVYRTIDGETVNNHLSWILCHMFNHATHHRGQVHDMLTQVPVVPPQLDLIYFLRESA